MGIEPSDEDEGVPTLYRVSWHLEGKVFYFDQKNLFLHSQEHYQTLVKHICSHSGKVLDYFAPDIVTHVVTSPEIAKEKKREDKLVFVSNLQRTSSRGLSIYKQSLSQLHNIRYLTLPDVYEYILNAFTTVTKVQQQRQQIQQLLDIEFEKSKQFDRQKQKTYDDFFSQQVHLDQSPPFHQNHHQQQQSSLPHPHLSPQHHQQFIPSLHRHQHGEQKHINQPYNYHIHPLNEEEAYHNHIKINNNDAEGTIGACNPEVKGEGIKCEIGMPNSKSLIHTNAQHLSKYYDSKRTPSKEYGKFIVHDKNAISAMKNTISPKLPHHKKAYKTSYCFICKKSVMSTEKHATTDLTHLEFVSNDENYKEVDSLFDQIRKQSGIQYTPPAPTNITNQECGVIVPSQSTVTTNPSNSISAAANSTSSFSSFCPPSSSSTSCHAQKIGQSIPSSLSCSSSLPSSASSSSARAPIPHSSSFSYTPLAASSLSSSSTSSFSSPSSSSSSSSSSVTRKTIILPSPNKKLCSISRALFKKKRTTNAGANQDHPATKKQKRLQS